MLVIGEGVNGGDTRVARKLFHVVLREGAEYGAMDHPAQDARGVLDWFAAAKLDLAGREEDYLAAQLADAHLEGDPGARGGFGEQHGPGLTGQGQLDMVPAFLFEVHRGGQDGFHVRLRQRFNA